MRAYGQGFLIADQSASVLDPAIQRNTNTKIAFCAPFEADREILSGALSLDDEQKKALARLESHTAIVKQNNWADAVQCRIDIHSANSITANFDDVPKIEFLQAEQQDTASISALHFLLSRIGKTQSLPVDVEVINGWANNLQQGGTLVAGIWKKLCTDPKYIPSEEETGQALYAFPKLTSTIQQAFQSTETPEGMRTRLIIELEWASPILASTQIELSRFISLLLMPCKSDEKVVNVLNSLQ